MVRDRAIVALHHTSVHTKIVLLTVLHLCVAAEAGRQYKSPLEGQGLQGSHGGDKGVLL